MNISFAGKWRIFYFDQNMCHYFILFNFFPPEYKTVLHQSGYPVHHHSASCQAHWQSHYQQSHSEDWWPQTYKNGPNHQPVLQQQDCTGYCGTEEQVCFSTRCSSFFFHFHDTCPFLNHQVVKVLSNLNIPLGLLVGTKPRRFSWLQDKQKWRSTSHCPLLHPT